MDAPRNILVSSCAMRASALPFFLYWRHVALAKFQNASLPGLYIYPTVDMRSKDAMSKAEAVRKVMPSGILIYQPPGVPGMTPKLLGTEFATEVVQALLAALLLSFAMIATYWGRVGFVVLVGLASAISTNISYWNWYSFPASYTLANMGIEIASFIAAALVIAALVKPKAA